MNEELFKEIKYGIIIVAVLIGVLYISLMFIPVHKDLPKMQVVDSIDIATSKCEAICVLNKEQVDFTKRTCLSEKFNYPVKGYSCESVQSDSVFDQNFALASTCSSFTSNKVSNIIYVDISCKNAGGYLKSDING